jgi:hypothetical protein
MEKNENSYQILQDCQHMAVLAWQHNLLMAIIWLVLYYFDVLLFAMPKDIREAGSYSYD